MAQVNLKLGIADLKVAYVDLEVAKAGLDAQSMSLSYLMDLTTHNRHNRRLKFIKFDSSRKTNPASWAYS